MPMKKTIFVPVAALAILFNVRADDKIDFAKSIQPLLEKRCLECHGSKKQKGDLRLDTKEAALKGGSDAKAIVPGKPDESDMVRRISLDAGHDDIMPPKGDPLTKEQIALVKQWISEGATWPEGLALSGEADKKDEKAVAGSGRSSKRKPAGQEFASLTPTKDTGAEESAIKKLAALGISVRPIAQNLQWKEATVRPQDTNKTSEAVALLKEVPSLVDLNIAKLNLSNDDLKNIAELKNLQRLHLENNPISDAGLAHIKGLVNLEYLNLYNTQVGDSGVENLKGLTNLAALYLWQSKVTDDGAATLKKALPETMINRGEELKLLAKVEEKKAEEKKAAEKKAEEDKKAEEKKEAKPEEKKKEDKAEAKKDEKPAEVKKDEKPAEPKKEEKKAEEKKNDDKKAEETKA
jgi:hypothetical protein